MRAQRPILYSLTKGSEVRHLLIDIAKGPAQTALSRLDASGHAPLATGTEYEMRQKAELLITDWTKNEGFELSSDQHPAFESLEQTLALAALMKYQFIYDPSQVNVQKMNLTGQVPLKKWPGMTAKNGGRYEYALAGITLVARPNLPPNHGLNMRPQTNEETIAVMREAAKRISTYGPTGTFALGGGDFAD